jgi:hypothetical protein
MADPIFETSQEHVEYELDEVAKLITILKMFGRGGTVTFRFGEPGMCFIFWNRKWYDEEMFITESVEELKAKVHEFIADRAPNA